MTKQASSPASDPGLFTILSGIPDPRREHRRLHKLGDVLTIAMCTVLCGHAEFTEMEAFGELREDWLRGFLELANGIPSHDTFRNVFAAIEPARFLEAFALWTRGVRERCGGGVVAFDGKALRGTRGGEADMRTVVGAWAADAGLALGQLPVEGKTNEITVLPRLLEFLDLKGCIVTADAMGCQKEVAEKCVGARADYVLALKGNQGLLHAQVAEYLDGLIAKGWEPLVTAEKARGRGEVRRVWAEEDLGWLEGRGEWKGLRSVAAVELERTEKGRTTVERRYFITSLKADAEKIGHAARAHWSVENSLHWVLDVVFGEDRCRARTGHAAANLSSMRRLAINLIKAEKQYADWSVKKRRFAASQKPEYLMKLLSGKCDA